MGVSWFGSRARQDRVNNRAKGMSLSVKGISPLISPNQYPEDARQGSKRRQPAKPRETRSQRLRMEPLALRQGFKLAFGVARLNREYPQSMSIRCCDSYGSCDCYNERSQSFTKVTEGYKRSLNSMAEIIGRKWQFAAAKIKMQVKLLLWLRQACMMLRLRSAEPCDEVM